MNRAAYHAQNIRDASSLKIIEGRPNNKNRPGGAGPVRFKRFADLGQRQTTGAVGAGFRAAETVVQDRCADFAGFANAPP